MKKFKKYVALFIAGVALCLTGCGEDTAKDNTGSNIAEEADNKEVEGTVLENDNFKCTVDKEWKELPLEIMPGAISIAKSNDESINIIKMPEMPELEGVVLEDYQITVENNLKAQPGCEIISNEIKDTNLGKIIYIEAKTTTTKEMIQQAVDAGMITQEALDAAGGIEIYENGMVMDQVAAYYLDGATVIGFTAQTGNGVSLDDAKAQLDKIISNIEIK